MTDSARAIPPATAAAPVTPGGDDRSGAAAERPQPGQRQPAAEAEAAEQRARLDPAVVLAARLLGVERGQHLKGEVIGLSEEGLPVVRTPEGDFTVRPGPAVPTKGAVELVIISTERSVAVLVLSHDGVRLEPPRPAELNLVRLASAPQPPQQRTETPQSAQPLPVARSQQPQSPTGATLPLPAETPAEAVLRVGVAPQARGSTSSTSTLPTSLANPAPSSFAPGLPKEGAEGVDKVSPNGPSDVRKGTAAALPLDAFQLEQRLRAAGTLQLVIGGAPPDNPAVASAVVKRPAPPIPARAEVTVLTVQAAEQRPLLERLDPRLPLARLADSGRMIEVQLLDRSAAGLVVALPDGRQATLKPQVGAPALERPAEHGLRVLLLVTGASAGSPQDAPVRSAAAAAPSSLPVPRLPLPEALLQPMEDVLPLLSALPSVAAPVASQQSQIAPADRLTALILYVFARTRATPEAASGDLGEIVRQAGGSERLIDILRPAQSARADAPGEAVRAQMLPLQADGQPLPMWLTMPVQADDRRRQRGGEQGRGGETPEPFRIDIRFPAFGATALHGAATPAHLDLAVESERPFPQSLQDSSRIVLLTVLERSGMTGTLTFE